MMKQEIYEYSRMKRRLNMGNLQINGTNLDQI